MLPFHRCKDILRGREEQERAGELHSITQKRQGNLHEYLRFSATARKIFVGCRTSLCEQQTEQDHVSWLRSEESDTVWIIFDWKSIFVQWNQCDNRFQFSQSTIIWFRGSESIMVLVSLHRNPNLICYNAIKACMSEIRLWSGSRLPCVIRCPKKKISSN